MVAINVVKKLISNSKLKNDEPLPQALCRPGGGEVPVHERDAAGDQVQRASQHHLQQQDQPRRPVTNPPGVTRQALSQELHGIIITTNM